MPDDDEPTNEEIVAMHLWKKLPPEISVYLGPPADKENP